MLYWECLAWGYLQTLCSQDLVFLLELQHEWMSSSCTEPRPAHKSRAAAVGFGWRWQGKEERVAAVLCVEETVANTSCLLLSIQVSSYLLRDSEWERGVSGLALFPPFLRPVLPLWHLARFPVVDLKYRSIGKHLDMSLPLSSGSIAPLWTPREREGERGRGSEQGHWVA